ncbi:MAG TPA: Gfo/Idh/MocA family oxidoreductase [Verrucomicrobiae bacterium]|nr:Gfo/Idh/MocA family oxidoreductase [Verrucomicrobiae bacterium]
MKHPLNRRQFLKQTGLAGASLAALGSVNSIRAAESPSRKILVGIMGVNGRGMAHVAGYLAQKDCEIAYICDVDSRAMDHAISVVAKKQSTKPQGVKDFRTILDDKRVDALSIAAPNHWHAPATILACAADKHVYVEKPCCHNPHEGELMVAAARKHKRVVQMGNQRRSWPWVIEAMNRLKAGEIGKVCFARTWYNNSRASIGHGNPVPVPEWLDWSLWQGPAPEHAYLDNVVHYKWHWRWLWGNGELGNNGIHALDLARWGLGVDYPTRVTCSGGRYHYQDDQETPDTYVTTFDFGNCGATWDGQSCDPHGFEGQGFGCTFYGEKGTLIIAGNNYKIVDPKDNVLAEVKGEWDDKIHFGNFLDAIREEKQLNSEIAEGAKSTLLCHLGNIAYRTGRTINFDAKTQKIADDHAAMRYWKREYRKGWEPRV